MTEITFNNRQRNVKLKGRWLTDFSKIALVECLKHPLGKQAVLAGLENVDVVIVSDRVIADVHRKFMDIEGPTDVITFDHGEIIISADTARTYAKKYDKPLDHEVALYIVHGLLHLNGYNDIALAEARAMHKLQNQILKACLRKATA